MYIPFDEMAESSRIWVYQADRMLTDSDESRIQERCIEFFDQWAAHGQSLKSSFKIVHHKFLIVSVDESHNQASGCSIDASVALMKELEQELNINFFDRTRVSFLVDDEIFDLPMSDIKSSVSEGKIEANTITFNNLVEDIGAFNQNWKVEAKNSWLKRYFQ